MAPPGPTTLDPNADPATECRLPYDRQFHPAVLQGHLTAGQAAARGSRQAMGERLVREHRLSLTIALCVADNRITLAEARARAGAVQPARFEVAAEHKRSAWPVLLLVAVGLIALGATLVLGAGRAELHRARKLVEDFERGKPAAAIDYGHPVYETALDRLDRIPGYSLHAQPAALLRDDIQRKLALHRARLATESSRHEVSRRKEQTRRAAFISAFERDRLAPPPGPDPDCESEHSGE